MANNPVINQIKLGNTTYDINATNIQAEVKDGSETLTLGTTSGATSDIANTVAGITSTISNLNEVVEHTTSTISDLTSSINYKQNKLYNHYLCFKVNAQTSTGKTTSWYIYATIVIPEGSELTDSQLNYVLGSKFPNLVFPCEIRKQLTSGYDSPTYGFFKYGEIIEHSGSNIAEISTAVAIDTSGDNNCFDQFIALK